jgi:hypothetical protein
MPSTATLTPSGDTTGATDRAAINTALGSVGAGGSLLLGPGDWYTDAPVNIPSGTELAGIKSGINGRTATAPTGSVIHPVAAFSGPGVMNISAAAGIRIRDLAILNDIGSPADVDDPRGRDRHRRQPLGISGEPDLPHHRRALRHGGNALCLLVRTWLVHDHIHQRFRYQHHRLDDHVGEGRAGCWRLPCPDTHLGL